MYFAIIDEQSDISRLPTVAYGETLYDIAKWFTEELADTYDMYRGDSETEKEDGEKVISQCEELCSLAAEDEITASELEGMSFAVNGLSIELYSVCENFERFCEALGEFVNDKPKYVKIVPNKAAVDEAAECDRINSLLIKASI